jgi:hypothetical protein
MNKQQQQQFWGPGLFHQAILDEAHRLRTGGTPLGKSRKANGAVVKMSSYDCNMYTASRILSLEPQYKGC